MKPINPVRAAANLAELETGMTAVVKQVKGKGPVAKRLMEMGIVPGVKVRVVKSAPFGDPIELRVRGFSLALRISEARKVEIMEKAV
ncbi:MAG: ferrous iron transport protein A [Acidobacteriota bacterium]|nr:ferrous iron transport protein A [Acidobacteriota bacterium]MDH3529897.1 ferrous iron transport protein A [Acidobacteriota bacterium]